MNRKKNYKLKNKFFINFYVLYLVAKQVEKLSLFKKLKMENFLFVLLLEKEIGKK